MWTLIVAIMSAIGAIGGLLGAGMRIGSYWGT